MASSSSSSFSAHVASADYSSSIPVIDISCLSSSLLSDRMRVAGEVGRACRQVGFFFVRGHGIPLALVEECFAQSGAYFAQPLRVKAAQSRAHLGGNRGYVGLGVERLDDKSVAATGDRKEAFNIVWSDSEQGGSRPPTVWPEVTCAELAAFRPTLSAYLDSGLGVARLLHRAFALDLGLEETFFDDKIDRPQACLRLLHYPAPEQSASNAAGGEDSDSALGCGQHCDYGNLTLLVTDGVAGLQVQRRSDSTWIDAPHVPGALLANLGDTLQRWTNDVYRSTPHRVLRPLRERYSLALFCEANPDALVDPRDVASCCAGEGGARYPPITADAYLQSRFAATYKDAEPQREQGKSSGSSDGETAGTQ